MLNASVIVCAHNPRPNYLHRVLDALRRQSLPFGQWELLLVDNASREALSDKWDISWHPNGRNLSEPRLGLTMARSCGIEYARAEILIFVDDDNVLDENYLATAVRISADWPMLGVWGAGRILPEFENGPPPRHLEPLLGFLALRDSGHAQWTNIAFNNGAVCKTAMPWGAGLCVRGTVAHSYVTFMQKSEIQITDRTGDLLFSGGDVEICLVACRNGYGMGTFPELKLTHLIPKARLTPNYLLKIHQGHAASDMIICYKWLGEVPRSPLSPRGLLGLFKNVVISDHLNRKMHIGYQKAALTVRKIISESKPHRKIETS